MNKVQYLGYIIDEHRIHVDPANIQVIRDLPAPTTLTELQSFLGLVDLDLGVEQTDYRLITINTEIGRINKYSVNNIFY
jgi:hypothetical protein